MELHEELALQRNYVERNRENAARLAQVNSKYHTNGQGSIEFGRRVDFGLTFVEEPWLAYGCHVDTEELADRLNISANEQTPLPVCSGFVTDWDRDERDFYVGAWVAVRVFFPPKMGLATDTTTGEKTVVWEVEVPFETEVDVTHYFTFSGVALKDVPLDGGAD